MPCRFLTIAFFFAILLTPSVLRADQIIYDDALENGWQDWGWAIRNSSASSPAPVHSGTYSYVGDFENAYDGLRFNQPYGSQIDSSPYASISFWINGDTQGGQQLWLRGVAAGGSFLAPVLLLSPIANTWTHMTISLSDLGLANRPDFEGIVFMDSTGTRQGIFELDDISLVSIPEPSALVLFGFGLICGFRFNRRLRG